MKVIGNLNIENKLQVGNLNVPTFNMEVDGGDNEIHAKFYGNYGGNQGILVERSGGDNVKLLAGYTGYGGGLESKSALRFSVGGNNLSTPAVHITESSVVNISEYIKFPYVNSTNTVPPNIPNVATKKTAIWMDMEGDESYLEYGHVDAGQTYTQFRVTDNNSGDRFRIYIDDWEKVEKDRIPLDVRGDRVLLSQDGGNVGIGIENPTHRLHVEGAVKIVDGTQGIDKVLTSDADGVASWEELSGLVGGMISDTNTHVSSGQLNATNLDLLLSDGSSVPSIDLSDLLDDTNLWTEKAIGNNIYRDIGNVGIGLTSPENRLSVKRTIGIMNDDWNNSTGTGSRLLMGLKATSGDDYSYIQAQDGGGTSNNNLILQQYGGRVGIGTTSPASALHVDGQIKIVDGTEGADKVLTSDADGLGTWQNISSLMEGMVGDTNNYVTAANIGGNTLILKRNGGLSDITVDLSQFMDDTNTDTYVIGGEIIKGAVDCDHKIRLNLNNGSFIAGAIDVSSLASDNYVSDLTLVGSQLTLTQSNDCGNEKPTFQVDLSPLTSGLNAGGDNDWTVSGNDMYSTPSGLVGIGVTNPNHKLHVSQNSANDIVYVDSSHSSFSYGGASGIGNKTNNVILKHKDTGGDNTSSSWQTRGSDDKIAIEVTTYFNKGGSEISYNAIAMHAGEGKVSILSADNDADDAILSIQSDSKIGFQNNSTSWPSGKKETMTIDLTTDRVGINAESPDCNLHLVGQIKIVDGTQSQGKVLTSNADGLASWQTPAGDSSFPVGSIIQFAGDTAPDGWLMCDGSSYNEMLYTSLYNVIGNMYGVGEGSGFPGGEVSDDGGGEGFRVPNLSGRVPVGKDKNDSDFNSLGEKGGTKEETLSAAQIPHKSHTHAINNDSGSKHHHEISWVHDGQATYQTSTKDDEQATNVINLHHSKRLNSQRNLGGLNAGYENSVFTGGHKYFPNGDVDRKDSNQAMGNGNLQPDGAHTHTMDDGSASNNSNGSPHNNLQPYIVLNYIIYAGV